MALLSRRADVCVARPDSARATNLHGAQAKVRRVPAECRLSVGVCCEGRRFRPAVIRCLDACRSAHARAFHGRLCRLSAIMAAVAIKTAPTKLSVTERPTTDASTNASTARMLAA